MKTSSPFHRRIFHLAVLLVAISHPTFARDAISSREVRIGSIQLHIECAGSKSPTVVIETGFGEFASDWVLVLQALAATNRVCVYDRAGYGASAEGPQPRTNAQINLELRTLLLHAGEHPPFVLVGHSFGGGLVRSFAATYPADVSGLVLAEAVSEHEAIWLGDKAGYLKDFAHHRPIPKSQLPSVHPLDPPVTVTDYPLEQAYKVLPIRNQELHRKYINSSVLARTWASEGDWSPEYYAEWDEHPQTNLLEGKPLVVVTRKNGDFPGASAAELERTRLQAQVELLTLSVNSVQIVINSGHDFHLEAPEALAQAIKMCVLAVRKRAKLPLTQ